MKEKNGCFSERKTEKKLFIENFGDRKKHRKSEKRELKVNRA